MAAVTFDASEASDDPVARLRAHEARIERRSPALIAAIDTALGAVGRQTRRWLLVVRETYDSGTQPPPDPPDAIAEEIGIQAPRLAARLAVDRADRAALADRQSRFGHLVAVDPSHLMAIRAVRA